jgi:hypothetical protein
MEPNQASTRPRPSASFTAVAWVPEFPVKST